METPLEEEEEDQALDRSQRAQIQLLPAAQLRQST